MSNFNGNNMKVAISVNPTYKCNLNCDFCYLKNSHNSNLMDLNKLDEQLSYIYNKYDIKYIELYGGEITILEEDYLTKLMNICEKYSDNVEIVTNFVKPNNWLYKLFSNKDYRLGTSWDYKFRPQGDLILKNIDSFYHITGKKPSVIMCSPKLYDYKEELLTYLDRDSIEAFCLIPCMKTPHNNVIYDWKKYEDTVKFFVENKIKPRFENESKLKFNREFYRHIFINPNNEYVDVSYDKNGVETFQKIDIDNLEIEIPTKCLMCHNFNKCQNEHLEHYLEDSYDCIGFSKLIDWYDERIS